MRWRMRCASSILPSASNCLTCSSSSCRISSTARSIVGCDVTYCVAGKIVMWSYFESTSPVSGSKCVIASTSSPKNEMRYAVSEYAGCTSTTSPLTRNRPRPSSVSLRTYWMSISLRSIRSRSCSSPDLDADDPLLVLVRRAEAVDARHRRDDDHVAPRQEVRASPSGAAGRCRRSATSPSRCRGRPAGRTPRAGSSRSTRRSTRPRSSGRTRGTRCRAARRASCCAR